MNPLRERYRSFTEPGANGLPKGRVIAAPLAFLGVVFAVLVALGVTGSSTGIMQPYFQSGADDRAIAGTPQSIRSDEWLVQTGWTISQVEQGLPYYNETLPGGQDATVQNDLPALDWSIAFRPHLWGFLALPLDQAVAFKWWLPGLAMIAAVYFFAVTLMPRRPLSAFAIALSTFWFPFMQWWYLPITFWPPALAFLLMASVVWALRASRARGRIGPAVVSGYVAVIVGMSVYVPFILCAAFPALAFFIGAIWDRSGTTGQRSFRERLRALLPLLASGFVAGVVVVLWAITRWNTITGFLSTVYPGQRTVHTGSAEALDWRALFGAPFTIVLRGGEATAALGPNSSEASTVILVGLFLLVPLAWLALRVWKRVHRADVILVSVVVLLLLAFAFLAVPGWDPLAHLLLLDRIPVARLRMMFGIVSVVLCVLMIHRLDQFRAEFGHSGRSVLAASVGATIAAISIIAVRISISNEGFPISMGHFGPRVAVVITIVLSLLTVASVFAFGMGWSGVGSGSLLLLAFIGAAHVNPLYRGVYNLNQTPLVREMKELEGRAGSEARWVGVGTSPWPNAVLMQAGLPAFNGVQGAPPKEMWQLIDPDGAYEQEWNRLANVFWVAGEGAPHPQNPAPDQIMLTFDSCSSFAQDNVTFVLSDTELTQKCLVPREDTANGSIDFRIYEVVPVGP